MPDTAANTSLPADTQALFRADDLLRGLLELSLTGIILFKPVYAAGGSEIVDLAYVQLNPAAQRMLRLPERPTRTFLQLYPQARSAGIFDFYRNSFGAAQPGHYEVNYQADGLDSFFQLAARRVGQGLLVSFTATADHHRTAVEEALRESQAGEQAARAEAEAQRNRLHNTLMQTPAAIASLKGPDHILKLVNDRYQQLFGPRQLVGKAIGDAQPELRDQGLFALLDQVYRTGETYYGNEKAAYLDRANTGRLDPYYFNFIYQATRDAAGRIEGVLIFAYDITEQVLTRRQIQKSELELAAANEELAATNEELAAANEEMQVANREILAKNEELFSAQLALRHLNLELEARVVDRTLALQRARTDAEVQRARLERFFLQAPAAICVLDGPNLVYELVNPSYQRLFPGRDFLGRTLAEVMPELREQPVWSVLRNVYQTGETVEGKEVLVQVTHDDSAPPEDIYLNFIYQARFNEHGRIDGILVFAYEVTEQVLARRKVEQSQESLRMALEAGNMATFSLNMLTNQTERSEGHDFIFGYDTPQPEWNLAAFLGHMPPKDRTLAVDQWNTALRTGVLRLTSRIQRATGELRWIESHGKVFYDEAGHPVRVAGVITDITERKLAQQQLQTLSEQLAATNEGLRTANMEIQATNAELGLTNEQLTGINQDLDNFVYTASHDLRQPINNMAGIFEELKRTTTFHDPEAPQLVEMFEAALGQIHRTIQGLVEVVQVGRRSEHSQVEAVDLLPLTRAIIQSIDSQAGAIKAEFQLDFAAVPTLCFARLNLQSILYNLLSNALKYAHPERRPLVRVTTTLAGAGGPVLVVQDNGLGLDVARYGPELFQMFRRFHDHVAGSGLGLYLVNRIVQQAGGHIDVESVLGAGTTFRIRLPTSALPKKAEK